MRALRNTRLVCVVALSTAAMAPLTIQAAGHGPKSASSAAGETVSMRDLDLSTEQGVQRAYERIRSAAKRVCMPAAASYIEWRNEVYKGCFTDAVARATRQVHQAKSTTGASR
jgi:UrcA family protein